MLKTVLIYFLIYFYSERSQIKVSEFLDMYSKFWCQRECYGSLPFKEQKKKQPETAYPYKHRNFTMQIYYQVSVLCWLFIFRGAKSIT